MKKLIALLTLLTCLAVMGSVDAFPPTGGDGIGSGDQTLDGDLTVDTDTLVVDSTYNRVGIGTATPSHTLDIATGNILLEGSSTNLQWGIGADAYIKGGITTDFMAIGTNNAEALRVDANQNVGIGTATPAATLDISGTQKVNGAYAYPASVAKNTIYSPQAYVITNAGSNISMMENGSGWADSGCASSNSNDTNSIMGANSYSCTTDGAGTTAKIYNNLPASINVDGKDIRITLQIDDATALGTTGSLYLRISTAGDSTDYLEYGLDLFAFSNGLPTAWNGQWRTFRLSLGRAVNSLSSTDTNDINYIYFVFKDDSSNAYKLTVDAISFPKTNKKGVVAFAFNCIDSIYSLAKQTFSEHGMQAGCRLAQNQVGQTGKMTLAQLQEMSNIQGWDVSIDTYDVGSSQYDTLTVDQIKQQLAKAKTYQLSNRIFKGAGIHKIDSGEFSPSSEQALQEQSIGAYFITDSGGTYDRNVLPPENPFEIIAFQMVDGEEAGLESRIGDLDTSGGMMVIYLNGDIVTATPGTYDFLQSDLDTLLTYIEGLKNVEVATLSEILANETSTHSNPTLHEPLTIYLDAYGGIDETVYGGLVLDVSRSANGDALQPTQITNGSNIWVHAIKGWNSSNTWSTTGRLLYQATDNYTSGLSGSKFIVETTPDATSSKVESLSAQGTAVFIGGGTNVVYRCDTLGALPVGTLTIDASKCGSTTDTGLRVQ